MRAARAVDELDVRVQRQTVAPEADRHALLHLVEVEGEVALLTGGARHRGAGQGRHVHLGLDTRGHHLRGLDPLRGQDAVFDQEDVGVEARAFVTGAHLGDDPRQAHRPVAARNRAFAHDHVVELQVLIGRERDPEVERRRVVGAEHPAHGFNHAPTVLRG